jgi:hypothetical protein
MSASERDEARPAGTPWPVRFTYVECEDGLRAREVVDALVRSGGAAQGRVHRARIVGNYDFIDKLFARPR